MCGTLPACRFLKKTRQVGSLPHGITSQSSWTGTGCLTCSAVLPFGEVSIEVVEAKRIEARLPEIGKSLFKAVFSSIEAIQPFLAFRQATTKNRVLTIDTLDASILSLPGELLHDPTGMHLFREKPNINIRRGIIAATQGRKPARIKSKRSLHSQFVVSCPTDAGFSAPGPILGRCSTRWNTMCPNGPLPLGPATPRTADSIHSGQLLTCRRQPARMTGIRSHVVPLKSPQRRVAAAAGRQENRLVITIRGVHYAACRHRAQMGFRRQHDPRYRFSGCLGI
jgi:hypothetical protein